MIGRAHRFHGHNSLNFVYRQGKTVRGQLFSLKYVVNSRRKTFRVSVIASKKISKSAVRRNHMRRRIYETVQMIQKDIIRPYDLVFTVFSGSVSTIEFDELAKAVKAHLKQAGVLSEG